MRFIVSFISMAAIFFVATAAGAAATLTVRATDQDGTLLLPGSLLNPGDQVTLDITTRSNGDYTYAFLASATDYDSNFLAFNSGEAVFSIFNEICIPGIGCLGGITRGPLDGALSEQNLSGSPGPQVPFFSYISVNGSTASGAIDPGVSGVPGGPQARLIFDVVGMGGIFGQQSSINIGSRSEYGDGLFVSPGDDSVETIWVVPEPSTALFMGLGLIAMSARSRQQC